MEKRTSFLIRIPRGGPQAAKETETFLADLHRQLLSQRKGSLGERTVTLEIGLLNRFIHFFVHPTFSTKDLVLGQIYAHFPGAEIEKVPGPLAEISGPTQVVACELRLEKPDLYPIKTYATMERDSLIGLSGVFSKVEEEGEQIWIQLMIRPIYDNWRQDLKRHLRRSSPIKAPTGGREASFDKFAKLYFQAKLKLCCFASDQQLARKRMGSLVNFFDQFDNGAINGLKGSRFRVGSGALSWFRQEDLSGKSYLLNVEELASLYHFPGKDTPIANVVQVMSKKAEPPQNLPRADFLKDPDISAFGVTNFRNQALPFGLKRTDRPRHLYLVGRTGMGKSKLLELLMLADIHAGRGFALLDPHGDLAAEVLRFIPEERIKDVIYFNPADEEHPIAFNPLQAVQDAYKQQVVTGFVGIFKKLFAFDWTPRLEHMLRYTVLALLDAKGATVVGIVRLLTDKSYRQDVIGQIQDPVVKNFWTHEFATWNEKFDNEAIVPLLNKVGEFISSPQVRNVIGQKTSSFNFHEIMDQEKILIMNLASGQIGEDNSALLGSMVVTQIQQAAMARAALPEAERKDFYLYVDEFQNFATSAFAQILSEARKYRLCLTVAHQYLGQLTEEVRKTVFGNVGSIIAFRMGPDDARVFQTEFAPVFDSEDLVNLDTRQIYLKMSIDGQTCPAFSGQTITVPDPENDLSRQIKDYSRAHYTRPKAEVEESLGVWVGEETEKENVGEEKKIKVEGMLFEEKKGKGEKVEEKEAEFEEPII